MIHLPTLNAILNSISACLVLLGIIFIKQKQEKKHAACMIGATVTSTLFLVSYLYYHVHHGRTTFGQPGLIRQVYLIILMTHTILAIVIVPMIGRTIYLAVRQKLNQHRTLARITFPIWIYVSVTGVVIYWMLYQMK